MSPNWEFNLRNYQTYIMGQGDEPTPIASATEPITLNELDEITNTMEENFAMDFARTHNIDVDSIYPRIGIDSLHCDNLSATRCNINDFSRLVTFDDVIDSNSSRVNDVYNTQSTIYKYTHEREEIINILKREKNVNTRKCMYVDDLVKEIAKIMEIHL